MLEIKEYFSLAMQYLFSSEGKVEGTPTQADIAKLLDIHPSTISDYTRGRREGSESVRRQIADVLGWEYGSFLSLGQLLSEKYKACDWELISDGKLAPPGFSVWRERGGEGVRVDALIIPPPGMDMGKATILLKQKAVDALSDGSEVDYFDCYETRKYEGGFHWNEAKPVSIVAHNREYLSRLGDTDKMAVFRAMDAGMAPVMQEKDMIIAQQYEGQPIKEGGIYIIEIFGQLKVRRLAVRTKGFQIYADNREMVTPYTERMDRVNIVGIVLVAARILV